MACIDAKRMAFQPLLIQVVLICALASALPSTASAQPDTNLPPEHTPIDWSDLTNDFWVGSVLWHTPTQLRFQLRAKRNLHGTLYVKAYYGEWFDKLLVKVQTRYGCGYGPPGCRLWSREEVQELWISLPSNPSKIKFEFEGML